ncbi:hypothetical protein CEXT_252461 [Caerostris extrusa]|uniref:Uncharacterized protein n=1 Tax=Caerostris extrusa TaxID=172846 RepID=A0AAV4MZB5_CAEEX|nr:hypothetical protein CEXT_252461 [Caerostris extrusa]
MLFFNPSRNCKDWRCYLYSCRKLSRGRSTIRDADDPLPYQSIFFPYLSVSYQSFGRTFFFPSSMKRRGRDGGGFAKGVRLLIMNNVEFSFCQLGIFCLSTDDVVLKVLMLLVEGCRLNFIWMRTHNHKEGSDF